MIKKDQAFNQGYEKLVTKGYLQTLVHLDTSFLNLGRHLVYGDFCQCWVFDDS